MVKMRLLTEPLTEQELLFLEAKGIYIIEARAGAEIRKLRADNARMQECLQPAALALNDWIGSHAPEFAGEDWVAEARGRIADNGGVLAYATEIRERLEGALAAKPEEALSK